MKLAKIKILLFVFSLACSKTIFAQQKPYSASNDSILLLNGDQFTTHILDTLNDVVTLKNPNGKKKNIKLGNERIFEIHFANGMQKMYYQKDSLQGDYFTIDEMSYFIKGEQDARKGYKPWWTTVGGAATGFGGGLFGSILAPIPVFAFLIACNIPKVRIPHESVSNMEYLKHDTYIMGYERVARSKRSFNVMKSGVVGLVVGIVVSICYLK
ncbi:MAG TPA: hypothetical protein VNG53_06560 [Bacteroidia bacterium]|nr:hypothetical protein [Bacteroidia bacterium]